MTGAISGTYADRHADTLKEPYGVVGLIFPWNGPVFNACAKLAPALEAGCSMVVKPAGESGPAIAFFGGTRRATPEEPSGRLSTRRIGYAKGTV
jgi:hypothetical protein